MKVIRFLFVWLKENMTKQVRFISIAIRLFLIGETRCRLLLSCHFLPLFKWRWSQRWKSMASLWGGYLIHGGACLAWALNIQDACIRCQIDSAIPKNEGSGSSSAAISIKSSFELPRLTFIASNCLIIVRGLSFNILSIWTEWFGCQNPSHDW